VHLNPGSRPELQSFVCSNSPAFVPVTVTLLTVNVKPLVFVSVTVCAALLVPINWLAKVRLVFESETAGACSRTETVELT
jgi:hypothetical protein